MIKRFLSLAVVMLAATQLFAQSVDQGKKFFYYQRYQSAKDNFEKVLAANPNNLDAVYWLGQTLIEMKDSIGAKSLYSKTLMQNGSAPMLLAGMGQIEIMEGKASDARQRFETAISLTKAKDIEVLNAIGRANVDARLGDANYAIEKLNLATQVKGFKNPDTYILLGDAYRKLIDGSNAVTAYTKALQLDPKLAAAKYKIGKVYLTQNNKEYFLPAFEEAVQLDPAYKPAYFELYYYWYYHDVNKAAGYLDKLLANSDPGPETDMYRADYLYAASKFAEAKAKAQELIQKYGDKVPRLYRLVAYASDTTGDEAAAKQAMLTFLSKAAPEDVLPADYEKLANINSKVPGSEPEAFENLKLAIAKDTLVENKLKYIAKAADLAKKLGNKKEVANWKGIAYQIEKNPSNRDLYDWAYANYLAGDYLKADSLFCGDYVSKYPTEIIGYLWCARSKQAMDTTMAQGLAVEAYKTLAEKGRQIDSVKYKPQIVSAYFYLVQYYNDIKKDPTTALSYINEVVEVDPTNADAIRIKGILEKAVNRPRQQGQRTGTRSGR